MIVAIHQPHFLPWLGYLDRMMKSDLFILLDHVQFERQNFQNRVRIKNGRMEQWLGVPVHHRSQSESIVDKTIDNQRDGRLRWGRKANMTLQYSYRAAPFYQQYVSRFVDVFDQRWDRLLDLNLALTDILRGALQIKTPMVRSSTLGVTGLKSELVLNLCKAVGADTFLGGLGGSREYLDQAAFDKAGIKVVWQEFRHPQYVQYPCPDTFLKGLSAVDMIFNCGPEARNLLGGTFTYSKVEERQGAD